MNLTILIIIVFIIWLTLLLQTPLNNYNLKPTWLIKTMAVYLFFLLVFVSMFINNSLNTKYFIPLVGFINFLLIVILMIEENSFNDYLKIILLLGFIYLFITFDYKRWESKKGILINPPTNWIVLQAIVLSFWYITANNKNITNNYTRYIFVFIILLPLLFPMKYYMYIRIIILALTLSIGYKYFPNKKNIKMLQLN